MQLHGAVRGYINAVNPDVPLEVRLSTGYTVADDGTQVPSYAAPLMVQGQIQPIEWRDLQQLDGVNLQGTKYVIYFFNRIEGIVRDDYKGGDMITDPYGRTFLTVKVLEQWGREVWCKIAAVLQNGG